MNGEISKLIEARADFGTETTYAGRRGPSMLRQMLERGYRVEGLHIGTETPDINVERVAYRARTYTGHHVDFDRVRERWTRSLSQLRDDAPKFDRLVMIDNSVHDEEGNRGQGNSARSRGVESNTRIWTRRGAASGSRSSVRAPDPAMRREAARGGPRPGGDTESASTSTFTSQGSCPGRTRDGPLPVAPRQARRTRRRRHNSPELHFLNIGLGEDERQPYHTRRRGRPRGHMGRRPRTATTAEPATGQTRPA